MLVMNVGWYLVSSFLYFYQAEKLSLFQFGFFFLVLLNLRDFLRIFLLGKVLVWSPFPFVLVFFYILSSINLNGGTGGGFPDAMAPFLSGLWEGACRPESAIAEELISPNPLFN